MKTSVKRAAYVFPILLLCLAYEASAKGEPPALRGCDCPRPMNFVPVCDEASLAQISVDMANDPNPRNYAQCNDITLSNQFASIGLDADGRVVGTASIFRGVYDGQSHAIRSLTGLGMPNGNQPETRGLFASISGTVRNLNLLDIEILESSARGAGALAARAEGATLQNISAVGYVNQDRYSSNPAGFLVDNVMNSNLTGLSVTGMLSTNQSRIGGVVGYLSNSTVSRADVRISISRLVPFQSVGGFAFSVGSSNINDLNLQVTVGAINSNSDVGGLALTAVDLSLNRAIVRLRSSLPETALGMGGLLVSSSGSTTISQSRVNVEIQARAAAGMIAFVRGDTTISKCEVTGSLSGTGYLSSGLNGIAGGLVALIDSPNTRLVISESAFRGTSIVGSRAAGGLVGMLGYESSTEIRDSYALGQQIESLDGNSAAGGIVGSRSSSGSIDLSLLRTYAFASVLGNAPGGILGGLALPSSPFVIESSIYSVDLVTTDNGFGTPETSIAMQSDSNSYPNFDFTNVWTAPAGETPRLRAFDLLIADYDNSGIVDVPDIFAYLSDYFAQNLRADLNLDSAHTAADIFQMLSVWFSMRS